MRSRFCIAALLAFLVSNAQSADSVRIAYINGISGTFAIQGEEQLKAFRAAAEWVNGRGGLLGGKTIEIVPFDNKNNPQESLIMLNQALDQDIHYVVSTVSSVVHALNDAIGKNNARNPGRRALLLNFNALDPALTEGKCSFWHFRFEPHSDMQLSALTDAIAKDRSRHRVYLINQDYAYGQSVSRAAREMLSTKRPDIQIVGDDLHPLGKVKDFAPYVSKIRAAGADSVITGNWGNDLSLLIKASKEAGLESTYYTLFGAFFGTPAAIGASGADRVKTSYAWHINAADGAWEPRLVQFRSRYKATSDMAYLPAFRVVEMLAAAMTKSGSSDPVKVAYALEGLDYPGPTGRSWMRPADHQLMAPIHLMSFAKAGSPGVKHDAEGTGFGWKTDALIDAKDTAPPIRCQMERPPRP
ncbi:MAG: branched-chain amino acid ABC transporter substrate-binding protein [Burkholderiales bacterium]